MARYGVAEDGVSLVPLTSKSDDLYPLPDKLSVESYGGGATTVHEETDQKVFITGRDYSNEEKHGVQDSKGNSLPQTAADILMHELVTHAIPHLTGRPGNPIKEENIVRKELDKSIRNPKEEHPR